MEQPRPGRPRDLNIDEAVLRTAREQLSLAGYESMSIAAVAEAAGTTRQAIYRRWPSKADLATAAVASMSESDQRPPSGDHLRDLEDELRSFAQGVTRRNGVSLVGTMLLERAEEELVELFRQRLVQPRRTRIRAILERAGTDGQLAPDADLDHAVAACTGILYAMAVAGDPVQSTWATRTAAFVWRGCGGQPND